MRSKLAASLARTAASVFICAMLATLSFFLCPHHGMASLSDPAAGKSCCGRLPVVVFVFAQVMGSGAGAVKPCLEPPLLAPWPIIPIGPATAAPRRPEPGPRRPHPPRRRPRLPPATPPAPACLPIRFAINGVRADVPPGAGQRRRPYQTGARARARSAGQRVVGERAGARSGPSGRALVSAHAAHLAEHRRHLLQRLGQLLHRLCHSSGWPAAEAGRAWNPVGRHLHALLHALLHQLVLLPARRSCPPSGPGLRHAGRPCWPGPPARPACSATDSTVACALTMRERGIARPRRRAPCAATCAQRRTPPRPRRRRASRSAWHRQDRLEHRVQRRSRPDRRPSRRPPDSTSGRSSRTRSARSEPVDPQEVGGLQHGVGDVVQFDLRHRRRRRHRRGVRRRLRRRLQRAFLRLQRQSCVAR